MTFVQIAKFEVGRAQKKVNFGKMFNSLLRNHEGSGFDTLYACY